MSFIPEDKKTQKNDSKEKNFLPQDLEKNTPQELEENLDDLIDENLLTLKKVHAILLNCINLTRKQKLEFAESERFFMKLHLKKLVDKLKDS